MPTAWRGHGMLKEAWPLRAVAMARREMSTGYRVLSTWYPVCVCGRLRPLSLEFGIHRDLGLEQARDRAACRRVVRGGFEFGFVGAGDLGDDVEVDRGDGEAGVGFFERDVGRGLDAVGGHAGVAELAGQGHREAAGVSGGDQFFG